MTEQTKKLIKDRGHDLYPFLGHVFTAGAEYRDTLDDWVSVKTKMPANGTNFLVTDGAFVMLAFYWSHTGKWDFVEKNDYWKQENITHWTNVPSPPKTGKYVMMSTDVSKERSL